MYCVYILISLYMQGSPKREKQAILCVFLNTVCCKALKYCGNGP